MDTNNESKSEMIEKIKKLLALSKSNNQHEAELAAKRASELMEKYQISSAVVEASSIKSGKERVADVHFDVPDLRMKYQWVVILGQAAAKLFDGTILVNNRLHGTGFIFVGFESEIPLMREMFLHLYRSWQGFVDVDLDLAKSRHQLNRERMSVIYSDSIDNYASWAPKDTMKFKHGHGQGYAEAIFLRCCKLAEERKAKMQAASQSCTALVLVRDAEVKKFLDDRGCGTKKLKQTRGDASGYHAGARAGQSVALGGALTADAGRLA